MIFDKQNIFCDHTAITAAGTNVIGDVIDLWAGNSTQPNAALPQAINGPVGGPSSALLGRLDEVELDVQISDGDAAGGTSVQLQLVQADDAALSSSPVVLKETAVVLTATLKAGYKFRFSGDIGVGVTQRYLGLKAVVVGSFTSAAGQGRITGGIVFDAQTVHV